MLKNVSPFGYLIQMYSNITEIKNKNVEMQINRVEMHKHPMNGMILTMKYTR